MGSTGGRGEFPAVFNRERGDQIRSAEIRLLCQNATTGSAVTVVASLILAGFEWGLIQHWVILAWLLYMLLVVVARLLAVRRLQKDAAVGARGGLVFAVGAALAGLGWGASGILLYPEGSWLHQVFLIFVLGGMMLGGASLLAARREAFLSFLIPTGLLTSIRLAGDADGEHLLMAFLGLLFTAATVASTSRLHRMINASLMLQFDNQDLLESLQISKEETDLLNQQLESRVQERTAELYRTNERLRQEMEHREQVEEQLLRVRNLESLGVLAGGIAHDFNNFLTVVLGNVELARMELEPEAPAQALLEQVSQACDQAVFLSSQLLTFAKGGAPVRKVVSPAQVVLNAVQLARRGSGISIEVDLAEDLWPIEVDMGQIGQALHNILLNAKQATPGGGIIEIRAQNVQSGGAEEPRAGDRVRISIKDYGCGIPSENLHRIFDPYFSTKPSGSGLGLATAHAIVAKHGGQISVQSVPGRGAEFFIDLPACRTALLSDPPVVPQLGKGTGRLLVMDDEQGLLSMLERVLTSLGYEVVTARDGAAAISLYENAERSHHRFDAVLLDLTVSGGMGGVEAAARLRELNPSVKLIVSSGYADAPVMSQHGDYGFAGILPKPWTLPQLSEVFQRVLGDAPERQPKQEARRSPDMGMGVKS